MIPFARLATVSLMVSLLLSGLPLGALAAPDPAAPAPQAAATERQWWQFWVPEPARVKTRIAIVDFKSINLPDGVGQAAAENLRSAVISHGRDIVIERSQIETILKEQQFTQSGLVDGSKAVELGKLLGVARIVVGSMTKLGATYTLNARAIDVRTAEATSAGSFSCQNENDVHQLVQQMAASLSGLPVPVLVATPSAAPVIAASPAPAVVVAPATQPVVAAPLPAPVSAALKGQEHGTRMVPTGQSKALAFTLGLLPGVGQFYSGNPLGGILTLVLTGASVGAGVGIGNLTHLPGIIIGGIVLGGIFDIGGAIEAFNRTEEQRQETY